MGSGILGHGQSLVFPIVVFVCLVVLQGVMIVKMVSQVHVPCALCVEIIGHIIRNFMLIVAINFPASLLAG